jgi:glutathione peroxidase
VPVESFHDLETTTLQGQPADLSRYRGTVVLAVNVASECGLTPQYQGLQALHSELAPRGFSVLGFPSNDFGGQEPGSPEQIRSFCERNYGVTFPMFAKVDVNGTHTEPLFAHLKSEAPGLVGTQAIKWNFTKFLVDRSGRVVKRFAPADSPEKIDKFVGEVLAEPPRG